MRGRVSSKSKSKMQVADVIAGKIVGRVSDFQGSEAERSVPSQRSWSKRALSESQCWSFLSRNRAAVAGSTVGNSALFKLAVNVNALSPVSEFKL